uniref:Uncharacterized protein n=1 Tax=Cacopsylla melanoneura TaxID=428564 RepID=A0A8D8WFN1_9HEMI
MTLLLHVRAPFLHLPARWPERLLMPSYSHRPRDLPLPFLLPFPFRGTPLRVHHGSTQGTLTCGHLQFESNREPPTTSKSRDMKSPASSPLFTPLPPNSLHNIPLRCRPQFYYYPLQCS